jgi:hypothetical protein
MPLDTGRATVPVALAVRTAAAAAMIFAAEALVLSIALLSAGAAGYTAILCSPVRYRRTVMLGISVLPSKAKKKVGIP